MSLIPFKSSWKAKLGLATVAILSLIALTPAQSQTFNTLHSFGRGGFKDINTFTNSDGFNPNPGLVLAGAMLYGTTSICGTNGVGTAFAINTNGTAFTNLYTFNGTTAANPNGGLVLSGATLYGTAANTTGNGDVNDNGVIFSLTTNKTFTIIYPFTSVDNNGVNKDGANSGGGLVLSGTQLYGTAQNGGKNGNGTIFSVGTSGSGFNNLHDFSLDATNALGISTNSDGEQPAGSLVLSGSTLYGTTFGGGTNGEGVVFKINTDGTGFQAIHQFDDTGAYPSCGLVLSGSTLFGMGGTVAFSLATNGAGFQTLHDFSNNVAIGDGIGGLNLQGLGLYGASSGGGTFGNGVICAMNTNGFSFQDFHNFPTNVSAYPYAYSTNNDGTFPNGPFAFSSGGVLYGTAADGGIGGGGTIFKVAFPFQILSLQRSSTNFMFSFLTMTNQSYTVQQITNLAGTNWITRTNFIGDGSPITITNRATNALMFRLRKP